MLAVRLLEREGYRYGDLRRPRGAGCLHTHTFDLALVDIQMPEWMASR